MRIGVLTGGGDVPGLNPCIKAIVTQAAEYGWEVIGFRRGWAGPLNYDAAEPEASARECLLPLTPDRVRTIGRSGGTVLHTSRTNPGRIGRDSVPAFLAETMAPGEDGAFDCTAHVLSVLEELAIDALIAIGGDDTLSYAARLQREGFRIMAVPKTMDNDVHGTDYCIGFSTAVSRSVEYINALRTPAGSHERIAVIELFGRNSGETALISGYLAAADRVLISEVPFEIGKLADFVVADRDANPSRYAVVVISEGASLKGGAAVQSGVADAYGHRKLGGIGHIVGEQLKTLTGLGIVSQSLAYLMRAGAPDSLDLMVASSYGALAVQRLAEGEEGRMMALRDGNYTTVPIDTCISGIKRVDIAELYDVDSYRPKVRNILDKPMFLY